MGSTWGTVLCAMEADYVRSFQDKSAYKCQDPNNKHWANDESRFGLKILKNFGWSEGKGLGANEDGNVDHIKIKKKASNSGIGETNNSSDNWLQGAFQYNSLLKRLNEASSDPAAQEKAPSSSTTRENQSKKKHLYQKRLRSRDASGYSKEDMDLILGKAKMEQQEKEAQSSDLSDVEDSEDEAMPLKVSTYSIYDYFQKKRKSRSVTDESEPKAKKKKRSKELESEDKV